MPSIGVSWGGSVDDSAMYLEYEYLGPDEWSSEDSGDELARQVHPEHPEVFVGEFQNAPTRWLDVGYVDWVEVLACCRDLSLPILDDLTLAGSEMWWKYCAGSFIE